jgi:hypothetical protein
MPDPTRSAAVDTQPAIAVTLMIRRVTTGLPEGGNVLDTS